jgi:hypothetical protein
MLGAAAREGIGVGIEAMALRAGPAAQVDGKCRILSEHDDRAADRRLRERTLEQEVPAAVEAEIAQVDDTHATPSSQALMVPKRSMARSRGA